MCLGAKTWCCGVCIPLRSDSHNPRKEHALTWQESLCPLEEHVITAPLAHFRPVPHPCWSQALRESVHLFWQSCHATDVFLCAHFPLTNTTLLCFCSCLVVCSGSYCNYFSHMESLHLCRKPWFDSHVFNKDILNAHSLSWLIVTILVIAKS